MAQTVSQTDRAGTRPAISADGDMNAATLTGVLTLLLTLLGWSAVPLFITHFSDRLDSWTQNGWRYGFSAFLWAPVLIWGWAKRRLPRGLWRASLWPALFNATGQMAFTLSFYSTDPTSATFGLRLQIVFVAIGAYLLFPSERDLLRKWQSWLAITLVLGGITGTIFMAPLAAHSEHASTHILGVALAIISGLLFAGYALAVRRHMHGFHPVTAFAAISQYTAAMLVGLMLIFAHNKTNHQWDGGASAWSLEHRQLALLLLSAIIGIALGHVLYYIALARLGVAVSSGVIQLQPFCVAVGQYFLLAKPVTRGQLISGGIALCGAVLLLAVQWQVSRARRTIDPGLTAEDAEAETDKS